MKSIFVCFTEQRAGIVPGFVRNTGARKHPCEFIHPAGFGERLNLRIVCGTFVNE